MTRTAEPCCPCGSETAERVMAMVEWLEPIGHERWSHVPRCADRPSCRRTVETVLGEAWPVNDRTPAPPRPEPVAAVEAPAPHAEEEISWLT